jgi:predicted metal-dependent hydrolase
MSHLREHPVDYRVRESRRARHVRLVVRRDGELEVVVPSGFDRRRIPGLVARRRTWVDDIRARRAAERAEWPADQTGPWPRRVVLPAVAEEWWIGYRPGPGRCRATADGYLEVAADEPDAAHRALDQWLGRRARPFFQEHLARLAATIGVDYSGLGIRGQRTRWGSCSARGHISLNRRLLMLPPDLVEYVLVHELCHRRHLHHGPAFHALVAHHLPDAGERENALRRAGNRLPPWLEG